MISQPISWYTPRTSAALPTPCFMLLIHSHRPHVMGSDVEFCSVSSVTVVARLSSCCAPSRSPSAPLFSGKFCFCNFLYIYVLVFSNSCPRSRLSFWSREEDSALPPRVGSPILHARAEFGAYLRAPFFPPAFRDDGAAAVCLSLPSVRERLGACGFS